MKKVIMMVLAMAVCLYTGHSTVQATETIPTISWSVAKPFYQAARIQNLRISYNAETLDQWKQELQGNHEETLFMMTLYILAEDGSYTDFVLPMIGELFGMLEAKAVNATDDVTRKTLASDGFNRIVNLLNALDQQIHQYQQERNSYRAKLAKFKSEIGEGISHDDAKRMYQQLDPQGSLLHGFYSSWLEEGQGDRSWDNYHQPEKDVLNKLSQEVQGKKALTGDEYIHIVNTLKQDENLRFGQMF